MSKILISVLLLMTMGFGGCKPPASETAEEDGGTEKYSSGTGVTKSIDLAEIISFECEFSLISAVLEEESELDGRVYALSAVLENDTVLCKIKWHDRMGDGEEYKFKTAASFMASLQKIVSKYNFARLSGYISKVSGLPDMYGAMLNIKYKSGDCIYAYDNGDCFISFDAMKELITLYTENK